MASAETLEERLAMFQADAEIAPQTEASSECESTHSGVTRGSAPLKQFSFPLRGNSLNPILDASGPLLALALNLSAVDDIPDTAQLRRRLINEISSIQLELHRLEYDNFTVVAHQYCLCAFIDEFIMTSKWGETTDWASESLLSSFHQETWAGDKFLTMIERLLMEPKRYLHLLEFQYVCLCLGYEGKYGSYQGNRTLLEQIIREAHDALRKAKGPRDSLVLAQLENAVDVPHTMRWRTPIAAIIGVAAAIATTLYIVFFVLTDQYTDGIIVEIDEILKFVKKLSQSKY